MMKSMVATAAKVGTCLAVLLSCSACSQTVVYKATVSSGRIDRHVVPVSVEVSLPRTVRDGSAQVIANGRTDPAQIERLAEDKARIWWIVSDLPAGQKRTYRIEVNESANADDSSGFTWKDSSTNDRKSMDLMFAQRPVLRYMYTPFDPADIENTKKPFHHVFNPDGSRLITKGAGGKFTHHRGIFFGYNKCMQQGQRFDTWHSGRKKNAVDDKVVHSIHRRVLNEFTGPILGGHVVRIHWNDGDGKPFIEETRRLVAFRQPDGQLLIEFESTLRPTRGPVSLTGDRQHAGVQFRAAQEVADNEKDTRYLRPAAWQHLPADKEYNEANYKDLPWDAIQYKLGDRAYTVAYLTDPANPDNAEFSERLYGRFGEYFPWELREDNPLSVRYRWWITATHDVSRETVQLKYHDLADPPKIVLD